MATQRKKKWVFAGCGGLLVATAIVVIACSAAHEDVGQGSSRMEWLGAPVGTVTDGSQTLNLQNVAPAWSPLTASDSGGIFFVATSNVNSGPPPETLSWFWSTVCNGALYSKRWDVSMAGSADCLSKTVLPSPTPTLLGSPSVAADGRGNVVYVGLADTDFNPNTAERVVAMISIDGGQHFNNMVYVNDDNGDSCNAGQQDLPHATFDTTVFPPTLYVVWRHKNSGHYGGCIRHGIIQSSSILNDAGCPIPQSFISWEGGQNGNGKSKSIANMKQSCTGLGCSVGQGGLMVQAGDGAVTVMYSGTDSPPTSMTAALQPLRSRTRRSSGRRWPPMATCGRRLR